MQSRSPRQKTHVVSLDAEYDVTERWTLGGKLGMRFGASSAAEGEAFVDNDAWLGVVSARYHLVHNWDLLAEVRQLHAEQAGTTETGVLVGGYRQVNRNMSMGLIYNFGRFSDDLTDPRAGRQGAGAEPDRAVLTRRRRGRCPRPRLRRGQGAAVPPPAVPPGYLDRVKRRGTAGPACAPHPRQRVRGGARSARATAPSRRPSAKAAAWDPHPEGRRERPASGSGRARVRPPGRPGGGGRQASISAIIRSSRFMASQPSRITGARSDSPRIIAATSVRSA